MSITNNKVVLITGASSGIGEALAYEYARQGYHLVLSARRKNRLEAVSKKCQFMHPSIHVLPLISDVTKKSDVEQLVSDVRKTFGRLDIVIANAGYAVAGGFQKLSVEDFQRQFETNIFGVLYTIYATLPLLKESRGSLVIMGSINSYVSLPVTSPYCMSKHAVKALAEALYWELQPLGIAVTLICPGSVQSEIRQIDNLGIYHSEVKDPVPTWLTMKSDVAARQMARAIEKRKKEVIITFHGKLLIYIQRFFPFLLALLLKYQLGQKLRNRPIP